MTQIECNHDYDYYEELSDILTGKKYIVSHCKYCNAEQEEELVN